MPGIGADDGFETIALFLELGEQGAAPAKARVTSAGDIAEGVHEQNFGGDARENRLAPANDGNLVEDGAGKGGIIVGQRGDDAAGPSQNVDEDPGMSAGAQHEKFG